MSYLISSRLNSIYLRIVLVFCMTIASAGISVANPPEVAQPTWREVIADLGLIVAERVVKRGRNISNPIDLSDIYPTIPEAVWVDVRFHRALFFLLRGVAPIDLNFSLALRRNPQVFDVWFSGKRRPRKSGDYRIRETILNDPSIAPSFRRELAQSFSEFCTDVMAGESTPPRHSGLLLRLQIDNRPLFVREVSRFFRERPDVLERLRERLIPSMVTKFVSNSELTEYTRFLLIFPEFRDALGAKIVEKINEGNGIPFHILKSFLDLKPYLFEHLSEIKSKDFRRDLSNLDFDLRGFVQLSNAAQSQFVTERENRLLDDLSELFTSTRIPNDNSYKTELIQAMARFGWVRSFSTDRAVLEITRRLVNLTERSDWTIDFTNALTSEILKFAKERPHLRERMRGFSKNTSLYLGSLRELPRLERTSDDYASLLNLSLETNYLGVIEKIERKLQDDLPLNLEINQPSQGSPTSSLEARNRLAEMQQKELQGIEAARLRLASAGITLYPLAAPLKRLENLIFQSRPPAQEGPLPAYLQDRRVNEQRMNQFGATVIDRSDNGIALLDARIRGAVGLEEGPYSGRTNMRQNGRNLAKNQIDLSVDLKHWRQTARRDVLNNLRTFLLRLENELRNVDLNVLQTDWRGMSDVDFSVFVESGQLEGALEDYKARAHALRRNFFSSSQRNLNPDQLMEALLIVAATDQLVATSTSALWLLRANEMGDAGPEATLAEVQNTFGRDLKSLRLDLKAELSIVQSDFPILIDRVRESHEPKFWQKLMDKSRSSALATIVTGIRTRAANFAKTAAKKAGVAAFTLGMILGVAYEGVEFMEYLDNHYPGDRSLAGFLSHVFPKYTRTSGPVLPFSNSRGGSRNRNNPREPVPFSTSQNSNHNMAPQGADGGGVMFEVGTVVEGRIRSSVRGAPAYHVGEHHEFADRSQVDVLDIPVSNLERDYSFVRTAAPTLLNRSGLALMPAPDDSELREFRYVVEGVDSRGGYIALLPGRHYEVLRSRVWGDYAIHVKNSNVSAVIYTARYVNTPERNLSGRQVVLTPERLRPISANLQRVGLRPLGQSIDEALRNSAGGITIPELAEIISGNSFYSHRQDVTAPPRLTAAEIERDSFSEFARFANEEGRFSGTCGSFARLMNRTVNVYFGATDSAPIAEVRPAFLNHDSPSRLTVGELHARTGVRLPGHAAFIVDSTSGTRDSSEKAPREDELPGSREPVSQNARYLDYRNLVYYAFLGGQRIRKEYLQWGMRQRRIYERDFVDLEELTDEQRAELTQDPDLWDQMQLPAESQGPAPSPLAFGSAPVIIEAPSDLEKVRTLSDSAYPILKRTRSSRDSLVARQVELRRRRVLNGVQNETPANFALRIDSALRRFINGDLGSAEFCSILGVNVESVSENFTTVEWQKILNRIGHVTQLHLGDLIRLRDVTIPRMAKTKGQTKVVLSQKETRLLQSMREPLYSDETIKMFQDFDFITKNITAEQFHALVERRLLLPEEHRQNWQGLEVLTLGGGSAKPVASIECATHGLQDVLTEMKP